MKMSFKQPFRTRFFAFIYRHILKPVFFSLDPELVHDRITWIGIGLGKLFTGRALTSFLLSSSDPVLEQIVTGMRFKNPVGCAAGFDKDGKLTDILPHVGFGFEEIGSITGKPCSGNARPRLWRMTGSKSLLVYYGLKNDGADAVSKRLARKRFFFPIGVSIAKTNSPGTVKEEDGIGFSAF